jgi:putative polyhydroxyalkanoate system protein
MARFQISKPHSMSKDDIRVSAENLAEELKSKHGVGARWQGDTVTIKRLGVEGKMTFDESKINISVTMGLLASAFEPVLKKEIERYLDENVS